jgi:hypothetical protein
MAPPVLAASIALMTLSVSQSTASNHDAALEFLDRCIHGARSFQEIPASSLVQEFDIPPNVRTKTLRDSSETLVEFEDKGESGIICGLSYSGIHAPSFYASLLEHFTSSRYGLSRYPDIDGRSDYTLVDPRAPSLRKATIYTVKRANGTQVTHFEYRGALVR